MTQYREAILEQIQKPNTHYSADQLYMKLKKRYPGISMATVYNHLHQLCEAGQIRRICVEVRRTASSTASLALETAVAIFSMSKPISEPLRLMIFMV